MRFGNEEREGCEVDEGSRGRVCFIEAFTKLREQGGDMGSWAGFG